VRARSAGGVEKPARFTATGPSEADHSLRLDEIDEKLMEQFRAVAEAEAVSNVPHEPVLPLHQQYCRFEFDLPVRGRNSGPRISTARDAT